jgi:hypothetical protein
MGASNARGNPPDTEILAAFIRRPPKDGQKTDRAVCRHCISTPKAYDQTWNTSELRPHLANCDLYKKWLQEQKLNPRS